VTPDTDRASFGWSSDFPTFRATSPREIRRSLSDFVRDASPEQVQAWDDSIPPLQREFGEVIQFGGHTLAYEAILEYELPMESRRTDVILLANGLVLVLELKGRLNKTQADVDQVAAYARDLRAYHRDCANRPVKPVLVMMRGTGRLGEASGVEIVGPDVLDELVTTESSLVDARPLDADAFLAVDAYQPLPSLVEAARELMETGDLRRVRKAAAATEPTLEYLKGVARDAASTRTRHLVLVSGLPGSGKTLVGLQLAHSRLLDELSVPRASGKPSAPAVYLSGNRPLVEVLQYELRGAGGDGKAFVRNVKEYVERYSARADRVPPEHVLIFDEAQRAFDASQVAITHNGGGDGKSEPEHFVEFAERVPEWCVVVGLIGTGQEIHVGEEAGIGQWLDAVIAAPSEWRVHVPLPLAGAFGAYADLAIEPSLELGAELRFHLTENVHRFVAGLLGEDLGVDFRAIGRELDLGGYHLRITRDLDSAKSYLRARYRDDKQARFGMTASARDSLLAKFGVPNDWYSTKAVRTGPWFAEGDDDPGGRSCRNLVECVTEFGCQGLELDAALLGWGNDFIREGGRWTNRYARNYKPGTAIKDALTLRRNAYRVLLTRGRDATVVFIPDVEVLDETYQYLVQAGFGEI
jgi:hypothetical protein